MRDLVKVEMKRTKACQPVGAKYRDADGNDIGIGGWYAQAGTTVEVTRADADRFVAQGSAVLVDEKVKDAPTPKAKSEPDKSK